MVSFGQARVQTMASLACFHTDLLLTVPPIMRSSLTAVTSRGPRADAIPFRHEHDSLDLF